MAQPPSFVTQDSKHFFCFIAPLGILFCLLALLFINSRSVEDGKWLASAKVQARGRVPLKVSMSQRLGAQPIVDNVGLSDQRDTPSMTSRRSSMALVISGFLLSRSNVAIASNEVTSGTQQGPSLTVEEVAAIIREDVVKRQFLATADITRSIYSDASTFTDEIDTYPIDKWVKGTKQLFVGEGSHVDLVGEVQTTDTGYEFRFSEKLMFRIPFRPVVTLTGRVVLERDASTGLLTSYREFWDQSIPEVLLSAKF